MISLSRPQIKKIKIYYYIGNRLYTNEYYDSAYITQEEFYNNTDIVKCEILFRYKDRRYTDILIGDINTNDIFKEIIKILDMGYEKK